VNAFADRSSLDSAQAPLMEEQNGISLWQLISNRKWLILFCVGVALGLGYLYFNRQPPRYQSTSRIYIYVDEAQLPVDAMRYNSRRMDLQNTHIQIIRSPLIVEAAVKEFGLGKLPSLKVFSDPTNAIIGNLHVEGVKGTDIISLAYTCQYPDDCKAVLEAIGETYKTFLEVKHKDTQTKFKGLIVQATNELGNKIEKKNVELASHRQQHRLTLKGDEPYNPHQARMEAIDTQRQKLEIEKQKLEGQISSIKKIESQGGNRGVLLHMLESFNRNEEDEFGLPSAEDSLNQSPDLINLYVQLEVLKISLGDEHPRVRLLEAEITAREKFYQLQNEDEEGSEEGGGKRDFVSNYVRSLEHQVQTIDAMIDQLDVEYADQQEMSYALDADIQKDRQLKRQVELSEQLVEILTKRLNEISLTANESNDTGGMRAQIIAPPGPGGKIAVNFNQIMTLSGGLGLLCGLILGYLLEVSDTSFRSPDDIAAELGVPVLGHIPAIDFSAIVPDLQTGLDTSLCTYYEPKSRTSEAYRAIRTALYFSTRGGGGHKVIQVTSPDPGDGKSTLAANLAVSIAYSGKRVLLIDADFRRPRVHKIFNLSDEFGVTSVINGEETLLDSIQQTDVENLFALVCGPRPTNPSELLTSPRFEEMLSVLREKYDFVIVDTPPMLAVTDPSAVAARVDGVFVALRLKSKSRAKATLAIKMLTHLGANVLGVVVNGVGSRQDHAYGTTYSYGGKSYRYGTYGYGEDEDDGYWFYYDDEMELDEGFEHALSDEH
jgi:capsular exopolysaccharide synthesis family protein